ncbi:MAG: FAD-dependent oxidoreductase, partial [Clostridia bacterium]|nr:FAD-dependent oxidoreductase [Clostridia bacterium]
MVDKKFDLIVVGGGLSGTAAAISAAREGLSVLLIDRNNCLGGAATECLVNPFMPYWTMDPETNQKIYLSKGMFSEILDELKAFDALGENEMKFSEEYLKLVLNRMVSKENIQVLFNTYLIDAEVE